MIYECSDTNGLNIVKTDSLDILINYARDNKANLHFRINGSAICNIYYNEDKILISIPKDKYYIDKPIIIKTPDVIIDCNDALFVGGIHTNEKWTNYKNNLSYLSINEEVDGLYIEDKKCPMSRYPKIGYDKKALSRNKIKSWNKPSGGYLHALHSKFWGGFSYKITGKSLFGNLKYKGGTQNNRPDGFNKDYVYVENIIEEITNPYEWCYRENENRIYAYLLEENNNVDLITNECIFKIVDAHDVCIKNLHIRGTKRTFMKTKEPLLRSDWTIYRGGAIYINECKNIDIENIHLEDIGSNAIFVDGRNTNINISRCHIEKIGASGVCFVGRNDSVRNPLFKYENKQSLKNISLKKGPIKDNYPCKCSVKDSIIENVGIVEKQASGVEISMAFAITIKWCSIYNTSRSGINIGDGTFGGHHIDGCDVFDTVKETGDHGSFNSWGRDRFWNLKGVDDKELYKYALLDVIEPNLIENSRFRCDRGWDIDLDDGSSNYEIRNNVCLAGGIKLREGFYRNVHHNLMVNNTLHLHVWYPNSQDKVYDNIVMNPYSAILMDNGFGEVFNNNILHQEGQEKIIAAQELRDITSMDVDSICVDCHIDQSLNVNNEEIDFSDLPRVFGVRDSNLKEIVRQPIVSKIANKQKNESKELVDVLSMILKDIENDGEMSTYGTSGHKGVIVYDVKKDSKANKIGIKVGDVIIDIAGHNINCIDDLININARQLKRGTVIVLREQILIKL